MHTPIPPSPPTQSRNIKTMLVQCLCTCHMLLWTPAPIPSKQIIKLSVGHTIFWLHTHWNAYLLHTHKHTHTHTVVSDITECCEQVDSPREYLLWTLQHSLAPSPLIKYERECFMFSPLLGATHKCSHTHTHTHIMLLTLHTLTLPIILHMHTHIQEIKGMSCSSAVFQWKAFLLKTSTGGAAGSQKCLCCFQKQGEGMTDDDTFGLFQLGSYFHTFWCHFC